MPLRIVTLGRLAPELPELLCEAAAPDPVEPLHVPASIQGVEACLRQLEPDSLLLGPLNVPVVVRGATGPE